jgi:hypothetical protein
MDAAEATVEAPKITAHAGTINAIIGAICTFNAVIAAAITAVVAYWNVQRQLQGPEQDREYTQAASKADRKATVSTTTIVHTALAAYRSDFEKPVELRVLPLPPALGLHDRKDFSPTHS